MITRSLFYEKWWLDCVCEDGEWGIVDIVEKNTTIAEMPWYIKKKYGYKILTQPPFTQTTGVWINSEFTGGEIGPTKRNLLTAELLKKLPSHDYFLQNLSIEINDWLPFYWQGYKQTTRYTYRLNNISNIDDVWSGINSNIKYDIKKAIKHGLKIDTNGKISDFIELYNKTFSRQKILPRFSEDKIKKLDKVCESNNSRKIIIISDEFGRNHAAVYLVWNNYCAYYLMGGGDSNLRNSGATSLALWEAIKFASSKTNIFDFEGSMIQPIEKYFRAFGGKLTPFFQISKVNSATLSLGIALRKICNHE